MSGKKINFNKFLNDDLNSSASVAGGSVFDGGVFDGSVLFNMGLFIVLVILFYHLTLDDLIYFYIDGCPYCIELDKKLEQMPLKLKIIKVNLKDNSKNDWRAKPLYYIGKYILGVKSAPTIYTKHYSLVERN